MTLHQTKEQLTVDGYERLCGCLACGNSYDDLTDSFIAQRRAGQAAERAAWDADNERRKKQS